MLADELRELHLRAIADADAYVRRVNATDLARPTPCTGWTLADFLAPDARAIVIELAPQPLPIEQIIAAQLLDTVVHTWDIAQALGHRHKPPFEVADAVVQLAPSVPNGPERHTPGSPFGPALPPGGAPWERALAQLGRDPRRAAPIPLEEP